MEASMERVPQLMEELEEYTYHSSTPTHNKPPSQALHTLFSLTEHKDLHHENRTILVREDNGKLIRVLLDYTRRCEPSSREQFLSLLVLNNMASENKRFIAVQCGGAKAISDLLYENPSCHLLVIVMMNLVLADDRVKEEVLLLQNDVDIVGSLAYALQASCSNNNNHNYGGPQEIPENEAEPHKARDWQDEEEEEQVFPETARWCLLALKNVTRSSSQQQDDTAAQAVLKAGIIPFLLRLVTIKDDTVLNESTGSGDNDKRQQVDMSPPLGGERPAPNNFVNDPGTWNTDSIQDAALFAVLNLCSAPSLREYMMEARATQILFLIADYGQEEVEETEENSNTDDGDPTKNSDNDSAGDPTCFYRETLDFQRLKARMALSFLEGSVGHFGQTHYPSPTPAAVLVSSRTGYSILSVTEPEVQLLVELLANSLHQRAKLGSYSATAFDVCNVIHAIRYLLTDAWNRDLFARTGGVQLNVLLFKALALHTVKHDPRVDKEAAACACFSLYLLSNYGFRSCYLPAIFSSWRRRGGAELASKVLTLYLSLELGDSAGRHAANQILRRLPWLIFKGTAIDLDSKKWSDFCFESDLKKATEAVKALDCVGAQPRDDIFNRPVLRMIAPATGVVENIWDTSSNPSVRSYPSALDAVPQFSLNSLYIRHLGVIDDIQIANNIARSANGEKTGCYGHWWAWKDTAEEIKRKFLERQDSILSL